MLISMQLASTQPSTNIYYSEIRSIFFAFCHLGSRIWPRAGAAAERLWSNPMTPASLAINRFLRYRHRLIARGIHPEAIIPKWCELHENSC